MFRFSDVCLIGYCLYCGLISSSQLGNKKVAYKVFPPNVGIDHVIPGWPVNGWFSLMTSEVGNYEKYF